MHILAPIKLPIVTSNGGFSPLLIQVRTIITTENKVIDKVNPAQKSLLFGKEGTWVKRGENQSFDVTLGSFDGLENAK